MDIKTFSQVNLQPLHTGVQKTDSSTAAENSVKKDEKKFSKKTLKVLPYVAGAVILAGLGFYEIRRRKNLNLSKQFEEARKDAEEFAGKLRKKDAQIAEQNAKLAKLDEEIAEQTAVNQKLEEQIQEVLKEGSKEVKKDSESVVPKAEEAIEKTVAETEKTAIETEKAVVETADKHVEAMEKTVQKNEQPVVETEKVAVKEAKVEEIAPKAETAAEETVINTTDKVVEETEKVAPQAEKSSEVVEQKAEEQAKPVKKTAKQQLKEATQKVLETINLDDQQVIGKIERNRKEQQNDITRILNENYRDGHMDMPMMSKIAKDYVADVKNRGEDRFHQAADLLEQALIREHIVGETHRQKAGLNFYMEGAAKTPLYNIYAKMPIEESTARIKYLKEHDLYADWYTDCEKTASSLSLDQWYEKTMEILVKKCKLVEPKK